MVGDIGGEIRVLAVVALHDAVFLIPERFGPEPLGSILFVKMAAFVQFVYGTFDLTGIEQTLLRKPLIKLHSEFGQILTAITQLGIERETVHPGVVLAQQMFGVRDQRIQMRFALAIGFVGGLFPAVRAARLPVTTALRAA